MIIIKKIYNIYCDFLKNELISNEVIKLVANDVNSTIFKFEFNEELSDKKVLFKLKKQNSDFYWIKEVIDNQIEIVDFDEEDKPLIVIKEPGIYEFELSIYDENSKLTNHAILRDIRVREELIKQSDVDNYVSSSEKLPLLEQLINQNIAISNEEKLRIIAESNRYNNEKERISNEDVRKTNETIRKENEVNREKYISDLKQDVADGKFNGEDGEDGKDYILTEQDEDNIADKVKIKLEPDLEANLKSSKDYTDNSILFDIKNVVLDKENYIMRFIRHDDTEIIFDLPIEMSFKDGYYDFETSELVFILMNDKEIRIPAAGLNKVLKSGETSTIKLSISTDGTITASIKGQSISKTHLTQELQDEINKKVNNDDYATLNKAGLVKANYNFATNSDNFGNLIAGIRSLDGYNSLSDNAFISKGTNEAIKGNYVKRAVQLDEVKEELHNQGFVKDDDLKPLKKKIDDNTDRIKRLEYDIYDSGEAEGSNIHIEDSTFAEAIKIEVDGVGNQETTEGNQLFNIKDGIYMSANNSYSIEFKDGVGKITVLDENFESASCHIDLKETILPAGTYTETNNNTKYNNGVYPYITIRYNNSEVVPAMINTDRGIKVFTLEEDRAINKITLYFRHFLSGVDIIPDEIRPQLAQGSYTVENMPAFEKFTYGASPNPDYPQEIKTIEGKLNLITCGKNLLKWENNISISISGDSKFIHNKNYMSTTILTEGLTELILSGNFQLLGDNVMRVAYSNEYPDEGVNYVRANNMNSSLNIININHEYKYITFMAAMYLVETSEQIKNSFQLEKSDKVTDFEPYQETKVQITIPEGEFVAEGDKISVEWNEEDREYHIYLYKNIGRIIYNPEMKLTITGAINIINTKRYVINKTINCKEFAKGKTSHFLKNLTHNMYAFDGIGYNFENNKLSIRMPIEIGNTIDEAKLYLDNQYNSGNPLTGYFELSDPYKLDLGIADMSKTFTEITNIFSDHPLQPNLHIKYYRDFKKTIKGLQAKVQTLEETSVKNTTFATSASPGIVRANYLFASSVDSDGNFYPDVRSLTEYSNGANTMFIAKGTLENVLKPIRDQLAQLTSTESEVNNNDLLQE